jgi:glycosyltransferase involved in cell wall biosynthesis
VENRPVPYNRAVKLAWFSPWPPQRSGVAGRSAELVPLLAARGHAIDVFVDAARVNVDAGADAPPAAGATRVLSAHDFIWRRRKGHYDLAVYQVGNSHLHKYIWPYMFRAPGLAVLHDARLHHARADALLSTGRHFDYEREFAWNHPDVPIAAATFGMMGLDGHFYFQWPMLRTVVETARVVAAHSRGIVRELQTGWPSLPIRHIPLGEGVPDLDIAEARAGFRHAHNIPDDALLFGVYGGLTAEKRLYESLKGLAAIRAFAPSARLLLAGEADAWIDLPGRIRETGTGDAVTHVSGLGDADFDRAIAAADVVLNLRWPSAGETSGPWLRSLALGRPTVIIDLPHQTHVPALDPRTWRRHAPCEDLSADADQRAVTVAIDILDLNHSLQLAMRRLATDAALRARIGRAARRWWEQEHAVEKMIDGYEAAFVDASSRLDPQPAAEWPSHLVPDPASAVDRVLGTGLATPGVRSRLAGLMSRRGPA